MSTQNIVSRLLEDIPDWHADAFEIFVREGQGYGMSTSFSNWEKFLSYLNSLNTNPVTLYETNREVFHRYITVKAVEFFSRVL